LSLPNNNVSRREFVASSVRAALGACALAALGSSNLRAASDAGPAKSGGLGSNVHIGMQTYLWGKDWDVSTIIANLTRAQLWAVELRTSDHYAHHLELTSTPAERREIRKRFEDSPIKIISVASAEELDWPDEAQFRAAVQSAKDHVILAQDVGSSSVRVFPNKWHEGIPHEKTIERIAQALNEIGPFAADRGILIGLEAHGPAGELPVMRDVLSRVPGRNVGVKLNSDPRDSHGDGWQANFDMVKDRLSNTLHLKNLQDTRYPYQLMVDNLVKMDWNGCAMMEYTHQVPDKVEALIEHRKIWEEMVANGKKKAAAAGQIITS